MAMVCLMGRLLLFKGFHPLFKPVSTNAMSTDMPASRQFGEFSHYTNLDL